MRVLIDECLPIRLRHTFPGHDARTVEFMGWKGLKNGNRLAAAEREGFSVVLTSDQSMYRQNDLRGRALAVIILPTNDLSVLAQMTDAILAAVEAAAPGEYRVL